MSTTAPHASSADERRRRIEAAWSAAWDDGDVAALDALHAPGYRRRSSTTDEGLTLEAFKATITTTRAAFPDLVTHIDEIVVEGDRAAVRWRSVGTHQHSFLGVPPTRRTVEVAGATFAHFGPDGLIVEEQVTWDPRALLTALGIITLGSDQ
ncbi:ester cyclase [Nocardioides dongxiaopingii]|uniref:ester cyclase n=1 Tax=Nocardioides sp. S-1144 TaxID=2582905 RepID=UPI00110EDA0E|nr:ester cyclase [Nocardioides sp. S-1144]QCW51639.1 ester cyclase [Nocardioides sp. S-1144]